MPNDYLQSNKCPYVHKQYKNKPGTVVHAYNLKTLGS